MFQRTARIGVAEHPNSEEIIVTSAIIDSAVDITAKLTLFPIDSNNKVEVVDTAFGDRAESEDCR